MIFQAHEYQKRTIEEIIRNPKYMLCLDMGLGKTIITLTAIRSLQRALEIDKCLVIAPLSVARNTWSFEVAKWEHLAGMRVSLVLGTEKQRKEALNTPADLYVINRENTQWLCELYPSLSDFFDMIVIDESSSFKSNTSKRWKSLRKAIKGVPRVVTLTGTPAPNGYEDLWAQYFLLDQGQRLGNAKYKYLNTYFYPAFGSGNVVYKYNLRRGAAATIAACVADITRSMKAEEYLSVPSMQVIKQAIILPSDLVKKYKDFQRELILSVGDSEITAQTAVALSNKLHQFTSGAVYTEDKEVIQIHQEKTAALVELLEAAQASGDNVLIFYQYKHEIPRILEALKVYNPRPFNGDPQTLKEWNDGKIKALLAHPAAVSYGLNMQQGGHIIVWYSLTWSLEQYQQANARLHRQGQTKPVRVYQLCAIGTIDELVSSALAGKNDIQEALLQNIKQLRQGT